MSTMMTTGRRTTYVGVGNDVGSSWWICLWSVDVIHCLQTSAFRSHHGYRLHRAATQPSRVVI